MTRGGNFRQSLQRAGNLRDDSAKTKRSAEDFWREGRQGRDHGAGLFQRQPATSHKQAGEIAGWRL